MPEFNTKKCVDYNSFVKDLNVINSEIKFNWSDADIDKVDNWIRRNWAYLRKGDSEENQDLKDFEIRLQRLARHDPTAKRIHETFTKCLTETSYFDLVPPDSLHPPLTNTSYFEIVPADILWHTVNFLGSTGRRILYDSHISEKTDAMIKKTMVMDLNKGLHVESLELSYEALKSFLEKHKESIKQLNLSKLAKNKAVELALIGSNLKALNLHDCALDLEALNKILNAKILSSVQTLNLSLNRFGANGIRALAASETINQVQDLNLSYNNFQESGARALAESKNLTQVQSLDLSGNLIGDEEARALAESKNFTQVQNLKLYFNQIRDKGARALAESKNFPRVQSLNLSHNKIGDEGARAFTAPQIIKQIQLLILSDNDLSEEEKAKIKNQFKEKVNV